MRFTLLISALAATALATPLAIRQTDKTGESDAWQPAADTQASCDEKTDKHISFMRGPPLETVINNACAAMMPVCAYHDRLPEGTMCAATIDFKLDGPKNSTQPANVIDKDGNSISGWDLKFEVTPAAQPENSAGVFWQREDCYGYFHQILEKSSPDGCHTSVGSGIGTLGVGGTTPLAGTVFNITIVAKEGPA